MSKLLFDVK